MNITKAELDHQRHVLAARGWQDDLRAAVRYTNAVHVDTRLLEAVASRETNMQNITGDGGHGRGMFQQDDRYQQAFLHSHKGCRPGFDGAVYVSALPPNRVPTVFAGAVQACRILEANVEIAKHLGVAPGQRTEFALAAYNAGVGGATAGWRAGDVDKHTAGGDYSKDVMQRYHALGAS